MLGIVAVGVVRSPEDFQGTHVLYRAHCAVIFAIAQLSCPFSSQPSDSGLTLTLSSRLLSYTDSPEGETVYRSLSVSIIYSSCLLLTDINDETCVMTLAWVPVRISANSRTVLSESRNTQTHDIAPVSYVTSSLCFVV